MNRSSYVFKETHFDKLTGLLRASGDGRQDRARPRSPPSGPAIRYFLIDIDIDRFKQINEQIGYSQGDELIRAFTQRLKASLPEGVVVGRIGAGEFAVLYPDCKFHHVDGNHRGRAHQRIDGALLIC